MSNDNKLSPNCIAMLALANEYCRTLEQAPQMEKNQFIDTVLRLLPRVYISADDMTRGLADQGFVAESFLDEDSYNAVRNGIAQLMGPDDTFLEVFVDDMKYSDEPIGASVSENLADIYQALFNAVEGARNATNDVIAGSLAACAQDFADYWGQTLCNVLRVLHYTKHNYSY